ncbi:MAG TPA: hypothetical protein VGO50_20900 [Pyrinomonadaceae bacterium]|jgi:hypothetical protein|nr:hypothetical protein [Pyrinomonadaceae bacterium]
MKIVAIFVVISLQVISLYGQKSDLEKKPDNLDSDDAKVKFEETKPTVYLEFERTGTGEPIRSSDVKDRIWLKMVNNTRWSIYVYKFVTRDKELGIFHSVEKIRANIATKIIPLGYIRMDVGWQILEIKPNQSVSFSVPRNHLAANLKIGINFKYKWEYGSNSDKVSYTEPRHTVFFSFSDLTRALEKKT